MDERDALGDHHQSHRQSCPAAVDGFFVFRLVDQHPVIESIVIVAFHVIDRMFFTQIIGIGPQTAADILIDQGVAGYVVDHRVSEIVVEHGDMIHLIGVVDGSPSPLRQNITHVPAFAIDHEIFFLLPQCLKDCVDRFDIGNAHQVHADAVDIKKLQIAFHHLNDVCSHKRIFRLDLIAAESAFCQFAVPYSGSSAPLTSFPDQIPYSGRRD